MKITIFGNIQEINASPMKYMINFAILDWYSACECQISTTLSSSVWWNFKCRRYDSEMDDKKHEMFWDEQILHWRTSSAQHHPNLCPL